MNRKTTKTHDLVNSVLRAILAGQYCGGDPIPSERDMAGQIGVSRVTVRRAYAELEKSAILERERSTCDCLPDVLRAFEQKKVHEATTSWWSEHEAGRGELFVLGMGRRDVRKQVRSWVSCVGASRREVA